MVAVTELATRVHRVVVGREMLAPEQVDWFWSQGVDMDDWNVMIIADESVLYVDEEDGKTLHCGCHWIDNMLSYRLENRWYRVAFTDGVYAVGVEYH